jgi:hypothetical protein
VAVTAAVSTATRRGDTGAPARDEAPRFSREPAMERARQA